VYMSCGHINNGNTMTMGLKKRRVGLGESRVKFSQWEVPVNRRNLPDGCWLVG